jgi:hypothetical protein
MESNLENKAALKKATFLAATVTEILHNKRLLRKLTIEYLKIRA